MKKINFTKDEKEMYNWLKIQIWMDSYLDELLEHVYTKWYAKCFEEHNQKIYEWNK